MVEWMSSSSINPDTVEVSGQFHALSLYPRGKGSWYPLHKRLGGPGTGLDAVAKKSLCPHPGIEPQTSSP
jgi:hypothetical protein